MLSNGDGSLRLRDRLGLALAGAIVLAALALGLAPRGAPDVATATPPPNDGLLTAEIRRTSHGIPNILANDWAGLGFGYGYAFAEDNICTIADTYVTVRAERSKYFGPEAGYPQRGNGFPVQSNLNSDFFYQRINQTHVIEDLLDKPLSEGGPRPEIREGVRGYVAGYNKYLRDTGVNNLPDTRCRGEDWVKPITAIDAYRRFYQLALLASQTIAIDGIGSAQPPPGLAAGARASAQGIDPQQTAAELADKLPISAIGSNAYGLGAEATSNGKGIVLGNPHFPWDGPERLYQAHMTIPGEVNVSGGSLYGVPLVLIGHTDNLAWSHTVSTAYRFTPFEETTNPAIPTQYIYDGQPRDMHTDTMTVQVKTPSGLEDRTRTLYTTSHGSVITDLAGVPLPWVPGQVFTMGDVNATNFRYLNHFFETNLAQSTDEYDEIEKRNQGIPWVNSIAADSDGKAYYADIGAIPNVSETKAASCNTPAGDATYAALRLPILDGALSSCEWDDDPDAAAPGIFGPSHEPSLFRDDYVTNSNDSYWVSNPEQPLTGFAKIIGDENTARALRTRLGVRMIQERWTGDQLGDADNPLTRQDVQDIVFNNRQYAGELWKDQLVTMCENAPGGFLTGEAGPVNVAPACPVLDAWDVHDNLNSNGAILFRRFAGGALDPSFDGNGLPIGLPTGDSGAAFTTPFSASDPINTPSGLNTGNPIVQKALADAVTDLTDAGIPLDAPLDDPGNNKHYQYEQRGTTKIPIHGGPGGLGLFNAINVSSNRASFVANHGYPNIPHGSSFVMVTQFTNGCPDDRSIVTYSQSENPDSPYFKDQTQMFSNKVWNDPPFCEDEVLANPDLTTKTINECTRSDGCVTPIADADGDGIANGDDNCPGDANADQIDRDDDGTGDACEGDADGDGQLDDDDNCPNDDNADQLDSDDDGIGDACDDTPNPGDDDGSGGGNGGGAVAGAGVAAPGNSTVKVGPAQKRCKHKKSKHRRKRCQKKRRAAH